MEAWSWTLKRRCATGHGTVAWDTAGEGPPLVLVHGTPFSSFVWRRVAAALRSRFTVFLYDLVGYGQSEKATDVSLGVQNKVLAALLGEWRLDRPVVMAHDFGGATALRAHLLDGCDYRRLLLVDAVALRPWGSPFVAHVREHEAAFAGMPGYAHEALLRAYLQTAAFRPLSAEALDGHARPWLGSAGQAAFYRQIAQMDQAYTIEIEDALGAVRCPLSVLWGEEDAWLPAAQGRELARRLGDAAFTGAPAAGHLIQEDAPEAVIHEILARME